MYILNKMILLEQRNRMVLNWQRCQMREYFTSLCYVFSLHVEHIIWKTGFIWIEGERRNISNLRCADTILLAEKRNDWNDYCSRLREKYKSRSKVAHKEETRREQLENFSIEDLLCSGSVSSPNGGCSQEIQRLRRGRGTMKQTEKILRNENVGHWKSRPFEIWH